MEEIHQTFRVKNAPNIFRNKSVLYLPLTCLDHSTALQYLHLYMYMCKCTSTKCNASKRYRRQNMATSSILYSLHHQTKALKFAAPDLFAAGNYANQVPGKKPDWPSGNTIRQSIAIGTVGDSTVHFTRPWTHIFPFHKNSRGTVHSRD